MSLVLRIPEVAVGRDVALKITVTGRAQMDCHYVPILTDATAMQYWSLMPPVVFSQFYDHDEPAVEYLNLRPPPNVALMLRNADTVSGSSTPPHTYITSLVWDLPAVPTEPPPDYSLEGSVRFVRTRFKRPKV